MTDATREKLKDVVKKKPLQTAILTTPEYDRGFEAGVKEGWLIAFDRVMSIYNIFDPYQDGDKADPFRKEIEKLKSELNETEIKK